MGKRIKLALVNNLVHYLSSTLQAQYDKRNKPWTSPQINVMGCFNLFFNNEFRFQKKS
jgi:hypothetical protein